MAWRSLDNSEDIMPYTDAIAVIEQASETGVLESLAPPIRVALFLGALAFLTTFLVSATSFTRIIIVLSFVRRGLSTQEIPPNPSLMGLALFLTAYTMGPTIDAVHETAIRPYVAKEINETQALRRAYPPLRKFMMRQTRKSDLSLFMEMADVESFESEEVVPLRMLVPAYMISELKTAFIMGFCIYVPFVLIDLLVSTVLMSLGMMMMPPVVVSAPIKLLLFVLADGWHLVVENLGKSFL